MPALTLRNLSEDLLRLWYERDERRRTLEREARQLKAANDDVEDQLEAALAAAEKTAIRKGGYKVELVDGRPSVSWKDEFIRAAGPEAAAAAIANAPIPKRLTITQVSDA